MRRAGLKWKHRGRLVSKGECCGSSAWWQCVSRLARPHPGRACLSSLSMRSWADCRACILLLAMVVAWFCVMGLKGRSAGSPFPTQACGRQAGWDSDLAKSRGTIPFAFISWAEDGNDLNQTLPHGCSRLSKGALHCKHLPSIIWVCCKQSGEICVELWCRSTLWCVKRELF